ncbi:acyl-CoA carboxylase subunit epsilon [Streptomyces sp. NBC_00433]
MSGPAADERALLRIERGRPTPEETAAVTAVLLAVAARSAAEQPGRPSPAAARWYRWERTAAFRPGHSWHLVR